MAQRERVATRDLYAEFQTQRTRCTSDTACRKALALKYGYPLSSIRRMLNEERLATENAALQAEVTALKSNVIQMYEPSAREDTDWDKWVQHVKRFKSLDRMVRVMMWNDMHMPDHDPQAVELAFKIHDEYMPDVNLVGSDAWDFDVLSLKYPRMYNRRRRDVFKEVEPHWNGFIDRLHKRNPDAVNVALPDNHAAGRFTAYVNERAPEFGDTLTEDWNDLVRAGGRVLWLGWGQEVRLASALFEHGLKAGENAVRSSAKQRGFAKSKAQGHGHTPSWYLWIADGTADDGTTQFLQPMMSVMSGHLANSHAHYIKHTDASTWAQGVVLANINMHGYDVHFQNIVFYPRVDGSLVASFGAQVFVVADNAAARTRANAA